MSKQRCDYCGREIEAEYMSTLDNGCPACPECVAEEEKKEQNKSEGENKNGRENSNQKPTV